ncbi:hypothetical protein AGMMS49992_10520 [Clostridia bacterium]|nr:hypothetical protein AGMMS49992_10520 [Clostridia bacterium]
MFKLIIADDETRSREGLCRIVDWASLGYKIVGCYEDGSYILEHLRREHADVVLADIRMKQVGGLEVAQAIREHHPNTVCVLISAYQEFDFAHQAIAYNVKDYLLKPTRLTDIQRVFTKIAHSLEEEAERMLEHDVRRHEHEQFDQLWRDQFLYDLYMGTLRDTPKLDQLIRHYYPDVAEPLLIYNSFNICRKDAAVDSCEAEALIRRLFTGSVNTMRYNLAAFQSDMIAVIAIMERYRSADDEHALRAKLEELTNQAGEMTGFEITPRITQVYESISAFVNRPARRIIIRDTVGDHGLSTESSIYFQDQQRLLFTYVSSGNKEQSLILAERIAQQLRALQTGMRNALIIDTVARIQTRLQEIDLIPPAIPAYDQLLLAETETDCAQWINEQVERWLDVIKPQPTAHNIIMELKRYINDHFSGNISLETVARTVFLSPVYVSRLFRQETGETFVDYVTRIRIDNAKALLRDHSQTVSQVSLMVGYPNPRYFYRVFREQTGYTPSEFRRLRSQQASEERPDYGMV